MKQYIRAFFGPDPLQIPDYARIVNEKRFDTLYGYLQQGKCIHGGAIDRAQRYMEPSLLEDVKLTDSVMQEEIFGPVLPVFTFDTLQTAVEVVKQYPAPLSLYLFTNRKATEDFIFNNLAFGGGCVNNTLVHFVNPALPFGGVGASGMGRYHDRYSFETFTYRRSVLKTATLLDLPLRYPPFMNKIRCVKLFMH